MTTDLPPTDDAVVVRREDDDEMLGHVVRTATGWRPVTVFGGALAEPMPYQDAVATVRLEGLASLADPWWRCGEQGWQRVWLLEVAADRLRVSAVDPRYDAQVAEQIDPRQVVLRRTPPPD